MILDILHFFIHPDYKEGIAYHDIAVLETENLNFTKAIRPVCLPRCVFINPPNFISVIVVKLKLKLFDVVTVNVISCLL
jgi:hypothetical protein